MELLGSGTQMIDRLIGDIDAQFRLPPTVTVQGSDGATLDAHAVPVERVRVFVSAPGYMAQTVELPRLGGAVPVFLMPAIVFITAGAMAFATGTSWATMAILIPLVIPLTVSLVGGTGFVDGSQYGLLLGVISSVLAGAIWGDHCSPISDTTVLSSTAAACDHVDHVRTQLPYAFLVGGVGLTLGSIGTALGLPNWIALLGGMAVLVLVLRVIGTPVAD